jgi:spermidine synthase
VPWLFLLAYTCSGVAGLVYEVSWTRLLTLYIGHSTAAAAAVVAAFLGGLALGAAWGGAVASRWTRDRALGAYVVLEMGVALAALSLPLAVRALTPVLSWAYGGDGSGLLFPTVRLLTCLIVVLLPAAALGATFPMAIRWFASETGHAARLSGALYALNTAGAAIGAMLAGFVLIPAIGLSGTTLVGVAGSVTAAAAVWIVRQASRTNPGDAARVAAAPAAPRPGGKARAAKATAAAPAPETTPDARWLAAVVLGISGFASLAHEIAWTRILALVFGPTTYAFAATLTAVIAGVAIGSAAGSWLVGRTRQPGAWLATMLALGAVTTSYTYSLAGQRFPALVAEQMAGADDPFAQLLRQGLLLTAALIMPTAICLGAAFPLALALTDVRSDGAHTITRHFGIVYATNTLGAVSGSLAAGFVLIPRLGLQGTLQLVSGLLIAAAVLVLVRTAHAWSTRAPGLLASAAAVLVLVFSPAWDRALLASGPYMYAPFVPADLDLETQLKAGELLYYREGASATVSVKRLTGTTTLAVDGKVDASNRGDMLTQKLIAHLPLLVHEAPRQVAIIGLGSGVTAGAALTHPIARADVLEISPEVVEASAFFTGENRDAMKDPRIRLIVEDGRSHLQLSRDQYDVIISEPSNPWIAGVAALFTQEFFEAARSRLAPGGVLCHWANAYNISEPDLRAIVATFQSVFPQGTVWLVGGDDVLMLASDGPLDDRLARMAEHWDRPGVRTDLASVEVRDPFSLWSLFVAGPTELARYGAGADLLNDDTMQLEFSAPRELHNRRAGDNVATLTALYADEAAPATVRHARTTAGVVEWRNRGAMMAKADVFGRASDDYFAALRHDLTDAESLEGFVRTALITGRSSDALTRLRERVERQTPGPQDGTEPPGRREAPPGSPERRDFSPGDTHPRVLVAVSKLQAASGSRDDALASARRAAEVAQTNPAGFEQLASLYADAGDTVRLDEAVDALRRIGPDAAPALYYAAVSQLLHGNLPQAMVLAERGIALHPKYAALYDLAGAVYTKMGQVFRARWAFNQSLSYDAHDSTAYENLGLLALEEGDLATARNYFAEALWLVPDSRIARQGLARIRQD